MKNLSNYKIVRINYPFSADDMEEFLWNKMTLDESKWAIQLTLKGINDTGGDESKSWDIFFLDDKLLKLIKDILIKYEIKFQIEELTDQLKNFMKKKDIFTENFLEKLNSYLSDNLTVDNILDNILKIGVENITPFERYFLDNQSIIKKIK